jgi:hypothetical protein
MLEKISSDEVKRIAEMAKAARTARDAILEEVADVQMAEAKPARGEHNPFAQLGLDPLPQDHRLRKALEDRVAALPSAALCELRALVWVGRGEYSAKDWTRAVADASVSDGNITIGALLDQVDLHDFLMKGLYELKLV